MSVFSSSIWDVSMLYFFTRKKYINCLACLNQFCILTPKPGSQWTLYVDIIHNTNIYMYIPDVLEKKNLKDF